LIELAYYCLITGFEGEHHLRADGRQLLDNLIEELYQLILQNRANKPHRLFKIQPYSTTEATHHRPILIATLLTVCAILSIYFITEVAIESKAKTVLMNYPMLAKLEHR
jgi:type IV/VI secretion system ImpK/VasF family protein